MPTIRTSARATTRLLAAAATLLAVLIVASPARAGDLRVEPSEGTRADYRVSKEEANQVTLAFDGTQYIFTDSAGVRLVSDFFVDDGGPPPPPPSGPCSQVDATTVSCPSSIRSWGVDLGSGGTDAIPNSFRYSGPTPPPHPDYAQFLSVYGGIGPDNFTGSAADDLLDAAAYRRAFGTAPNTVDAGGGNDQITGEDGPDEVHGGPGDDLLDGLDGSDTIFGDDGDDRIRGGPGSGPDQAEVNGNDLIRGGAGDDTINGWHGNDRAYGEAGKDVVEGGPGDDLSDGGSGADGLRSSFHGSGCPGGRDTFVGGTGRDSVYDFCGTPIFRLKDGERDKVECGGKSKPAGATGDRVDRFSGKPCRKFNPKRKKKKKMTHSRHLEPATPSGAGG